MGLDVRRDEKFQQREWRRERTGWALLAAFLVAGLVGLLGNGPFSWATARSDAGLVAVEYQRVTHHEADDSITLTFPADAVDDGSITVEITGSWVAGTDLSGISPEPSEQSAVPDGMVLEIPVERPGEVDVHVTFRAQDYGRLSADVVVGTDRTSFTQLVLP